MAETIKLVKEFHQIFGHPIGEAPHETTAELRELRVKLIAEELGELCVALGVGLTLIVEGKAVICEVVDNPNLEVDLVEVADALGDLDYVISGANLVFGIPAEAVAIEIHRSNMSKLGADGKPIYRGDGKILKGPGYFQPDIKSILFPREAETTSFRERITYWRNKINGEVASVGPGVDCFPYEFDADIEEISLVDFEATPSELVVGQISHVPFLSDVVLEKGGPVDSVIKPGFHSVGLTTYWHNTMLDEVVEVPAGENLHPFESASEIKEISENAFNMSPASMRIPYARLKVAYADAVARAEHEETPKTQSE